MYSALIIGCGNIGAGYDFNTDQILTHAKALQHNQNFAFSIFDTNKNLTQAVSKKYNCKVMNEINVNVLSEFDCVSICTPTTTHSEYLIKAIEAKTRVIICEKPVSDKYSDLELLRELYEKNSSKIIVNYTRRFHPSYKKLREDIEKISVREKLTNISIRYQRGFLNNCSHAFDTIEYLMNQEIKLTEIKKHNSANDHFENDPTISIQAFWNDTNMNVLGLSYVKFSHFEIDIYFQYHKIIINESGQRIEILRSEKEAEFLNPLTQQNVYTECLKNQMVHVISRTEDLLADKRSKDNFIGSLKLNQRMLNILQN